MIGVPSAKLEPRPLSPPTRDYLSYSAITTYQTCPLRYKFRYIDGLPEQTVSASLVFGSAIHRAAEYHFNELMAGNEPPNVEAMLGEYDAAWSAYPAEAVRFGKDDDRDGLAPVAHRVLAAFQASDLAKPQGVILGVEEELRGSVIPGCPDLLGRIDLIVETADALVVTDLKTARSRWSREQVEESASQLLLYSELTKALAPRKQLRLQFAVITKTKEPAVDLHALQVDGSQVQRVKRVVERVWRAIAEGHFYPAPSALNCTGCPFREPCRRW